MDASKKNLANYLLYTDELPLFEDDVLELGLDHHLNVDLEPGEEEDVMHVSLSAVEDDVDARKKDELEEMLRRWDHKVTVVQQ